MGANQEHIEKFDEIGNGHKPDALHNLDRISLLQSQNDQQQTPSKVIELSHLDHNSGGHAAPDAMVRLPENFDPNKPINLVIYNHGFYDSAKTSFAGANLDEQMKSAPPNTILVSPEWQSRPAEKNSNEGPLAARGAFRGMLEDAFKQIPELKGKSLDDVAKIGIISHSAGYTPAMSEIYDNGLESKISSVTLLDSLYNGAGFDKWLKDNIQDLSSGEKQFSNIFLHSRNKGTELSSKYEANRVEKMLADAGLPKTSLFEDYSHEKEVLGAEDFQKHSIIFKQSAATDSDKTPHMSLPNLYVGELERGASLRESSDESGSSRSSGALGSSVDHLERNPWLNIQVDDQGAEHRHW
jgi:hypothetical protein